MRNQIRQVFHSPKFLAGFVIFSLMLLLAIVYPRIAPGDPLAMVASSCYKPGTYISVVDAMGSKAYTLNLDITESRLQKLLSEYDQLVRKIRWDSS